ncbi:MAG: pyridoxal-phosphate dependent enzyme, partial [Chloroflexi bacterium]|nr:pyridoxal-phosphate dependent enzyme [Chloroflexota bacterium]
EMWPNASTLAAGIRVPAAIGDYLILQALRDSGGGVATVTDDEILINLKRVGTLEGMFICPEGAALVAALEKLLADGTLSPDENILILNTGSGLKYLDMIG